jgi:hypothetical protein
MKIVNLETFRSLPRGTISMKYEPCVLGDIFAKGDTWENDFLLEYITNEIDAENDREEYDIFDNAEKNGTSIKLNFNATMRDCCFNEKQLFAVWERKDVKGLIIKLKQCLDMAYNHALNLTKAEGQVR